jgi:hypothetical protein
MPVECSELRWIVDKEIIPPYQRLIESPDIMYGAMMIFFLAASTLLVLAAWRQLPLRGG